MGGRIIAAFLAFVGMSGALAASKYRVRRDESPAFSFDPDTTQYCTWWWDNDGSTSCEEMPSMWGISMEDFLRWNPSITATCGNFLADHSYCVEAFGEPEPTTSDPPPTTTTSTTAGPPGPTQPGQVGTCNRWDLVQSGDSCNTYIEKYPGLALADLVEWNAEIGEQCQYLWVDYYICTGVTGWTPTTTSSNTTPSPTNGIATPSPIQPGMVDNCDEFHLVVSGDLCGAIAADYGISTAQLIEYNPQVGADCSGLWLGYYVCVSLIGDSPSPTTTSTTTTTPGNGISTPTPTRPGMVGACDAFYMVETGDTCVAITQRHGISLAQLYKWNTQVGTDCSGLWTGYYICVSVVGVNPTLTTTTATATTTGNGIATPTPTQAGMVGNCNKFHMVVGGNTCESIATQASIPLARFYAWNSGVGSACQSLWLGYYVCIGVR